MCLLITFDIGKCLCVGGWRFEIIVPIQFHSCSKWVFTFWIYKLNAVRDLFSVRQLMAFDDLWARIKCL